MADAAAYDPRRDGDPLSSTSGLLNRLSEGYRTARHLAANGPLRLAYFLAVELAVAWPRLAEANLLNDHHDSQYTNLFEEAARVSVARFHELPLWDPYYCGGIYGLATPSARFVSPTFLLTLLFGTLRGDVLVLMAMTVIGMEGAFRYTRSRGGGALAAMAAAPVFALSGIFVVSSSYEWTNFFSFQLVPWALLGVRRLLLGERRGLVIAALAFAWMLGFGGTYSGPLTVIAAALEVASVLPGRWRRPERMGQALALSVLVAFLAAAMSMMRIWPIAETLATSPRYIGGTPGETLAEVWKQITGEWWLGFHKNSLVIGMPILPLLALGALRKRALPVTIGGVIWLWLSLGYTATPSLFALLRHIPPYTMLRAPERFLLFVALAAAAIAAIGIRRLELVARSRHGWVVVAILAQALLLGDTVLLGMNDQAGASKRRMVTAPVVMTRDFRQARGNRWLAVHYPFMSRGTLACFDDYDIPQSPQLRGDLPQEEYLKDAEAGTVTRLAWSPNHLRLHVQLDRPARVYINANWHPGWKTDAGQVVDDDGLLTVDVPEGTRDVTLSFRPRSAIGGIATSILGLVIAAVLWVYARRRPRIETVQDWLLTVAFTLVPFIATALAFVFVHEPRWPPPALITPGGDPMVVDHPPDDSTPVGARWEHGITLEAEHVSVEPAASGSGTEASIELDWRFDEPLPPGLGFSVHLERPGTKRVAADHVLLSGAIPPEKAPLHATVRDLLDPVALTQGKGPETWKVYIGVWWARRDGSRVPIVDANDHGVDAARVMIGTFETP